MNETPTADQRTMTTQEMLQLAMPGASVYANNTIFTTSVGGVKLTFIERSPEGMVVPRASVFLPTDYLREFYSGVGEFIKRLDAIAVSPPSTQTAQ